MKENKTMDKQKWMKEEEKKRAKELKKCSSL